MKALNHYHFLKAARPFSLVVGLVSCTLGVYLAWIEGYEYLGRAFLIAFAGVTAQAGINLINDLEDLKFIDTRQEDGRHASTAIRQNAWYGLGCFSVSITAAGYLISLHGWPLFWLITSSAITALSYNLGPINFKHRGLSMIQVFLLMGVLMVQGAYYSMSGHFSLGVLLHSIPISLLVSLLLLSNELRDWEYDSAHGVRTLTVRIGYKNATRVFWALISCSYLLAIGLLQYARPNSSSMIILLIIPLFVIKPINRAINANVRPELTPLTGRFFLLFGLSYILALA